jgi:SAM-dependent methyltransferase
LDAGCGNTGYFQVAMYNLGALSVTCLDIGDEWKPELEKVIREYKVHEGFCDLISGSTVSLPFDSESFDFVASNGVIMHLETVEMASEALSELARVTKKGGSLYSYIGVDKPGLVDSHIVSALRQAYKDNLESKKFIDNASPESMVREIAGILSECGIYDDQLKAIDSSILESLITLDTTTFLQNMIQVPIQQGTKLSEDWGREQFKKNRMINIRRPKGVYWKRNDFRRYLAPFHYSLNSPIAKLFYGNGHVKLIGEKD